MGMFDYKNYSIEDNKHLVNDAFALSAHSSLAVRLGDFTFGDMLNEFSDLVGEYPASKLDLTIPSHIRELSATDVGVSEDLIDNAGFFKIESLYTGDLEAGPQAKIFGEYNEVGELTRIHLNVAGTNSLNDILDYLNLNSREGSELWEPMLVIVKDFAEQNGLDGTDVVISGYSLGAAITNVIAAERNVLADGFFTDSDYIGFAVPTIYEEPGVVLNIGYENDVVHRITGDEPDFLSVITALDPFFVNPDKNFDSSTDNLVLFNDTYAALAWDFSSFSFLNIPSSWNAHISGMTTDAISRIYESSFYEETTRDSTVIVSDMDIFYRNTTWVEDDKSATSSHYGSAAFLIGTEYDDLIKGGTNFDYIDAGEGDDTIRAGIGLDHIDGGLGIDEVRIEGRGKDWDVFKTADDTLFFVDKDGFDLVEADNVESVSFNGEIASHSNNYEVTDNGLKDNRFLMKWFDNGDKDFLDHVEGSEGNDVLIGQNVFAREGDDSIKGTESSDTLHAGRGEDVILALGGNDRLYGAEGDDRLDGGTGDDILVGGIGNDVFVINNQAGSDTIIDFNNDVGYQDIIEFSADLFSNMTDLAAHTIQATNEVRVSLTSTDYLTILDATVEDVLSASVIA